MPLKNATGRNLRYDVTRWEGSPAIAELDLRRDGVVSRVIRVRDGRVLSRGSAMVPAPATKREVAIATFSGTKPDLYVIDRRAPNQRVRVTVFSGESGFEARIAQFDAEFRGLSVDDWRLDIARLSGGAPDLVGFSRNGTGSSHPELHVLRGDAGFRQYWQQRVLDVPVFGSLPDVDIGVARGRPSILLRSDSGSTVEALALTAA